MVEPASPPAGVDIRRDDALNRRRPCRHRREIAGVASVAKRTRIVPLASLCATAISNSRACHMVPMVEPALRPPVGVRRTARRYDANTMTHSPSTKTAIPAW